MPARTRGCVGAELGAEVEPFLPVRPAGGQLAAERKVAAPGAAAERHARSRIFRPRAGRRSGGSAPRAAARAPRRRRGRRRRRSRAPGRPRRSPRATASGAVHRSIRGRRSIGPDRRSGRGPCRRRRPPIRRAAVRCARGSRGTRRTARRRGHAHLVVQLELAIGPSVDRYFIAAPKIATWVGCDSRPTLERGQALPPAHAVALLGRPAARVSTTA